MNTETSDIPLISVIIVNHNGRRLIERCIKSVLNTIYPNFEVIVVDNGSVDGSTDAIIKLFDGKSHVKLLCNNRNLGPASARNVGLHFAKGKYVAFLDNDTEVDPNWLKEAVGIMELDHTISAGQCKIMLMDHRDKFDYAGDYLSQYGFLIQRASLGEVDNGQYDEIIELFSVKSAGMIARRDTLMRIRGFDDDYFIYMEETDLCWRIWLNNCRVVFMPLSVIYHAFGSKSKLTSTNQKFLVKYHGTKNYITTLIKDLEAGNLIKILPIHISLWVGITIWHIIVGRLYEANLIIKGILYNLSHLKSIWIKRKMIQFSIRKISDANILPHIMKIQTFTYFYKKLIRNLELEK